MSQQQSGFDRLFRFSILFLLLYLGLTLLFPPPEKESSSTNSDQVIIKSVKDDYAAGQLVNFEVLNEQNGEVTAQLQIQKREDGEWKNMPLKDAKVTIEEDGKLQLSYPDQNIELFQEIGKYQAILKTSEGEFLSENEFEVSKPGIFRSLWRGLFFKPIYNTLIFLLEVFQSHLGIAIIVLTLIIKFILLVPSKKGIIAQQKMQKLQPELEKIKKKYKNDQQKQAQEMMGLWKKHKVNPGAAILPTLMQFPILIALFFVIKEGLMAYNSYLLYPINALQNFDFSSIDFHFLFMNLGDAPSYHYELALSAVPYFALPVGIGLLQFWQMKSMMAKRKNDQKKNGNEKTETSPQESVMNMMTYFLPVLIVVFSMTLPAAVGLYWGVSTVFAIVQQQLLQKKNV